MKENQAVARTLEDKNQKIRCVPTNVKVTQSINERISLGNYEKSSPSLNSVAYEQRSKQWRPFKIWLRTPKC